MDRGFRRARAGSVHVLLDGTLYWLCRGSGQGGVSAPYVCQRMAAGAARPPAARFLLAQWRRRRIPARYWKQVAPAIDIIAPDIYDENIDSYKDLLALYGRPDNALFVPETGGSVHHAENMFLVLAAKNALGSQSSALTQVSRPKT